MFGFIVKTWNPVTGCLHDCYNGKCWASLICNRFKKKWGYDFSPRFHFERLNEKFKPNTLVFTVSMGDLFGWWVKPEWIEKILNKIKENPKTTFFLETKNPPRYWHFSIPKNTIKSTTIETNRNYKVSKAPSPLERYKAFKYLDGVKHVSIEPIMDFDHDVLLKWISEIEPWKVSIGYDNYNAKLPEPSIAKTKALIKDLKAIGIQVEIKNQFLKEVE
ncbi:MAG: hypothetical protein DRO36_05985 [Candidatus Hecatellales archaeon]|nr:MAG: hypothetical protein DRO36_05985 [Candidatus Hecatellales archaeon]